MSENFRTPFQRKRVQLSFSKPSKTKQCFKEECDINNILKKYMATGSLEHQVNVASGSYLDVSTVQEYQDSLDLVLSAGRLFSSLPSKVRARFDNDPSSFLEFASNPQNATEMADMGLIARKPIDVPSDSDSSITGKETAFSTPSRKQSKPTSSELTKNEES